MASTLTDDAASNGTRCSRGTRRTEGSGAAADVLRWIAASAGITQRIRSMPYDTGPLDPVVYVVVTFTRLMIPTLVCMLPAWRASRLHSIESLQAE